MKTSLAIVFAAALATAAVPASAAYTLIGSYWVGAGPDWFAAPPVYTGQQAAALLYGGVASDYSISTVSTSVTHTAWADGYGNTSHLKTDWLESGNLGAVAEDYSLGTSGGTYDFPSYSAYVGDHDSAFTTASDPAASINYVFIGSAVPEPASWGLILAGFAIVGLAARRRQTVAYA